jgi:hypothetical protein
VDAGGNYAKSAITTIGNGVGIGRLAHDHLGRLIEGLVKDRDYDESIIA